MKKWIIGSTIASIVLVLLVYAIFFSGGGEVKRHKYLEQPRVEYETEIYPVYIDFAFQRSDVIEMEKAINRWNMVLNGYRRLDVVDKDYSVNDLEVARLGVAGEAYLILRLEPGSELLNESAGSTTLAFTNAIGGTIMYVVPLYIESFKEDGVTMYGVMLHEIGHWMGAYHVEVGLMTPRYGSDYLCVDIGTARQVGRWFKGYNWEKMNYCIIETE